MMTDQDFHDDRSRFIRKVCDFYDDRSSFS